MIAVRHSRHKVVIGLGANLGSRQAHLQAATILMTTIRGCRVCECSSVFETDAVGPPQPRYLNAAVCVETELDVERLLDQLLRIESILGRERRERWGPRTIDLDILWSEAEQITTPKVIVPHPHLHERAFALAPLLEVAPELKSEYATKLQSLGGSPSCLGWLDPVPVFNHSGDEDPSGLRVFASDAADALAFSVNALLRYAEGKIEKADHTEVRSVHTTCAPGMENRAFLSEVLSEIENGFRPFHVVVTSLESGLVQGRLLGTRGDERLLLPENLELKSYDNNKTILISWKRAVCTI